MTTEPFTTRSLKSPLAYRDNVDADDAMARLELGAVDEFGAAAGAGGQNSYDGYVASLQADLRQLGVLESRRRGVFDEGTRDGVLRLQRLARSGRIARPVTYTGGVSGIVDTPTRAEIRRWLKERLWFRPARLDTRALREVLRFTAAEQTGGAFEPEMERVLDPQHKREVWRERALAGRYLGTDGRHGLRVGLLAFDQRSGWLGRWLRTVYELKPAALPEAFGPAFVDVLQGANERSERGRLACRLPDSSAWEALLAQPVGDGAGLVLAWREVVLPLLPCARSYRITTIKGLAFLVDVAWTLGRADAEAGAEVCERRDLAKGVAAHLAPALHAFEVMGAQIPARLIARWRRLLADPALDEETEYDCSGEEPWDRA